MSDSFLQCDLLISVHSDDVPMEFSGSVCLGAFSRMRVDEVQTLIDIEDLAERRTALRNVLEKDLFQKVLEMVETELSDEGFKKAFKKMTTVKKKPEEPSNA